MTDIKTLAHSLTTKERSKDVILTENVSFTSLLLPPEILKGLAASGFEKPSPIQVKALPVGRCGFDLILKSKSGTGKTLVFSIISLESIRLKKLDPQVLILAPTREIAVQIQEVIQNIGIHYEGLSVECFIGGLPVSADKSKCKSCHIAVGTPGRMKQLIKDGSLKVDSVKIFVLDEADKLTEDSFQNDINEIYNSLPDQKQIIMCSATYPDDMQHCLSLYMRSPVLITVELETPLLLGLKQYVRLLNALPNVVQQIAAKNDELLKIMSSVPFVQCIVFSNYQTRAESVSTFLNDNGWSSIFMSGAQNQKERLNSLSNLKNLKCKILVTTDLTSRGIDAANVDLVINYDTPLNAMTYLHRMGRAGRYGSSGNCINLTFIGQESKLLQNILGFIGGQNLSIPILDDSFNLDLEDIPKENHLFGEVMVNSFNAYNNEISGIRNALAENNKTNIKGGKTKKPNDAKNNIMEKTLSTVDVDDVTSVLAELASGSFEMSVTSTLNTNKVDPLKPQLYDTLMNLDSSKPSATNNKSDPDGKSENETNSLLLLQQLANEGRISDSHTANVAFPKKSETFCKNKALFSVAKVLSDREVSNEDCNDLSAYFSTLKSQENKESHGDCISPAEFLENIFSLAYKSQVSHKAEKWQNLIPDSEKGKLEEHFKAANLDQYEEALDEVSEEEYYDEDYDFEIEKDVEVEVNYTDNSTSDYGFMEWVPVVHDESSQKTKTSQTQISATVAKKKKTDRTDDTYYKYREPPANETEKYHSNYTQYYQHCSNNLWQNGLSFGSVESFDRWFFNDWERQLGVVRDFVQKNIYLEEMSNNYYK